MPRYRFSWDNLPDPFVEALAEFLGLDFGDPRGALRAAYGARPKEPFVRDAWPFLLDAWLADDADLRSWIAEELHTRSLGDTSLPIGDAAEQLTYLQTCRNARSLRQVVLGAFHYFGESEPARAEAVDEARTTAEETVAKEVSLAAPTQEIGLQEWVSRTLAEALGVDELTPGPGGDFEIRHGSSATFIRADDGPFVHLFSILLTGFGATPALHAAVNTMNQQLPPLLRAVLFDDELLLEAALPADGISAAGLLHGLELMCGAADAYDDMLRDRFGGLTFYEDDGDGVDV